MTTDKRVEDLKQDPDVDQVIGYPDKTMVVLDADTYLRLKAEIAELRAALEPFAKGYEIRQKRRAAGLFIGEIGATFDEKYLHCAADLLKKSAR